MKKKSIFVIIVVFIIIFNSVIAIDINTGLVALYEFDNNDFTTDSVNAKDVSTVTGTVTNVSGIEYDAGYFDGNDKLKNISDAYSSSISSYTINLWIKPDDVSDTDYIWHQTGDNMYNGIKIDSSGKIDFKQSPSGGGYVQILADFTDTTNFSMLTMIWTGTRLLGYIDTYLVGNESITDHNTNGDCGLALGGNCVDNPEYEGIIDLVAYYEDTVLNQSQIDALYNSGSGCNPIDNPLGCSSPTPTLTLNSNLTDKTKNYNEAVLNFNYNGTLSDNTVDFVNISFFLNGVHNKTLYDINITQNNVFNITFDTSYSANFTIQFNASNFEVDDTSDLYTYQVDLVQPLIQSDFVNNTQYVVDDVDTVDINFSDDNLFAFNISYKDNDGVVLTNIFEENLSVNFSSNISSVYTDVSGNYTIDIMSWDSHTSNKVKTKKIDYITDGFVIDDDIKIYSPEIKYSWVDLSNKKDRYYFNIEFNDNEYSHVLILETTEQLKYIQSRYKGHFIYKYKYWLDFESFNNYSIDVFKISDNKYQITVSSTEKFKEVMFNSIGDLNSNSVIYSYSVVDATTLNTQLLTSIDETLDNIYEVVMMLGLIIIYSVFMILSFIMIQKGQSLSGIVLWLMTLGFDFLFIGWSHNFIYNLTGTDFFMSMVQVMYYFLWVWLIGKVVVLATFKYRKRLAA